MVPVAGVVTGPRRWWMASVMAVIGEGNKVLVGDVDNIRVGLFCGRGPISCGGDGLTGVPVVLRCSTAELLHAPPDQSMCGYLRLKTIISTRNE